MIVVLKTALNKLWCKQQTDAPCERLIYSTSGTAAFWFICVLLHSYQFNQERLLNREEEKIRSEMKFIVNVKFRIVLRA